MKFYKAPFSKILLTLIIILSAALSSVAQPDTCVQYLKRPLFNYYSKQLNCDGIMIRSGRVVDDKAFYVAAAKIRMMLSRIPAAKHNLSQWGAELHIIGKDQQTSDLPEFADQKGVKFIDNMGNNTDIDARSRGLGGIYTSCGEENLLNLPEDRYAGGQDICIHEFAHNIMEHGLGDSLQHMIEAQYRKAVAKGLWKGAYAAVNKGEYWAEISMWYFGKHGEFLHGTRKPAPGPEALRAYDPEGYNLLDFIYSGKARIIPVNVPLAIKVKPGTGSSMHGAGDAVFMITNNTSKKLRLYWLDYDGNPKPYGQAPPYNSFPCTTYMDHVWEIRDLKGKLLGCYRVDKQYVRAIFN